MIYLPMYFSEGDTTLLIHNLGHVFVETLAYMYSRAKAHGVIQNYDALVDHSRYFDGRVKTK